jgi:hypothetical protein
MAHVVTWVEVLILTRICKAPARISLVMTSSLDGGGPTGY